MNKAKQIFGFNQEKLKQWLLYWLVLGMGFVILVFLITSTWIGIDIKERCLAAQGKYEGDCVESLIQVVDDEQNSFRERNSAVWALGQLGDERAKAVLEKHYTGKIPKRESFDGVLSQYELKKAINLIDGFNITKFIWRVD